MKTQQFGSDSRQLNKGGRGGMGWKGKTKGGFLEEAAVRRVPKKQCGLLHDYQDIRLKAKLRKPEGRLGGGTSLADEELREEREPRAQGSLKKSTSFSQGKSFDLTWRDHKDGN